MRTQLSGGAIVLLVLVAGQVRAQSTAGTPSAEYPAFLAGQEKGKEKEKEPKDKGQPPADPFAEALTQRAPESAEASRGLNPHTISDPPVYGYSLTRILLPSIQFTTLNSSSPGSPPTIVSQKQILVTTVTRVPVVSLGAFKIAENQSPLPEDRVFLTYNYFDGVRGPGGSFGSPSTLTQPTTFTFQPPPFTVLIPVRAGPPRQVIITPPPQTLPATINTVIPGAAPPQVDIHRAVFGFEKTILDGSASVGIRVPVFDAHGSDFSQSDLGDITMFLNYAFYRDAAGNVLSGGLAVTVPTGPRVDTTEGNIHPVLFQPFIGYRLNLDRFYLQGFTSVAVPTDSQAVTALFNDIGVGYYLYRGDGERRVTALIPTVEVHVTTPLNHHQATDALTVPDIVAFTGGMHIGLGSRSMLTVGVTAPVTGPRPWNVEAVAQFNFRF